MLGITWVCLGLALLAQMTASSMECMCVPLHECDANGTVIPSARKKREFPIEEECDCFNRPGQQCRNPKKVCCRLSHSMDIKELSWDICGKHQRSEDVSQFPWMATIYNKKTRLIMFGATIIGPRVLLTAANSIVGLRQLEMVLRVGGTASSDVQERNISRIIIHPYFNFRTTVYNVALVILDQPLERTTSVGPVCLPKPSSLYEKEKCLATAWTFTPSDNGSSEGLISEWLTILPRAQCQRELRTLLNEPRYSFDSSVICSDSGNKIDTCKLLGSGPLFCKEQDRYVEAGILNMNYGCKGNPPVEYVNIALISPWIWYETQSGKL